MLKHRIQISLVLRLLAAYVLPAFLLLVLLYKILTPTIFGEEPKPQIPPDGYIAYEDRVTLFWTAGDHPGPFQLQVANKTQGFRKPTVDKKINKTRFTLPPLQPGQTYCWRVLSDEDALVSCFKTNTAFVAY